MDFNIRKDQGNNFVFLNSMCQPSHHAIPAPELVLEMRMPLSH